MSGDNRERCVRGASSLFPQDREGGSVVKKMWWIWLEGNGPFAPSRLLALVIKGKGTPFEKERADEREELTSKVRLCRENRE